MSGRRTLAIATVAAIAAGGGTATASKLITGAGIKDGSLTARDVKKGSLTLNRLSPGLQRLIKNGGKVQGVSGAPTAVGQPGANGAAGANGANGTNGANGPKGDKGSDGATGAQGAQGDSSDVPRVVTAENLRGFVLFPQGTNGDAPTNGSTTFETPPATPPLGAKALRMTTNTGKTVAAGIPLRAGNDVPRLAELTTATYSQDIVNQVTASQSVSFKVVLRGVNTLACANNAANCSNGFTTLVFDPSNQAQQPVPGTFLRYNVRGGKFYSTRALASGKCPNTAAGVCSFDEIVGDSPDATIESIRVEEGNNSNTPNNAGFDAFVDDIRVGFDGDFLRYDLGG